MDTDGVRLFVRAAELLNISAAGRQLGLSAAVAGARLAKLENQLKADLFHRSTRKVSLSLQGEAFLPYAKEILAQVDAAHGALGHQSRDIQGTLRFSAPSTFAQLYIAPLLPEFLERHPNITLDLKFTDQQMNLIEGAFDLALRNYAIEDSSLKARRLADDKRILCASPAYLERYGTPQSPDDLLDHRLILFMDHQTRKITHKETKETAPFPPPKAPKRVLCDDGASMRLATLAGTGIAMNALWSIHPHLKDGSLVRVLEDYDIQDSAAIWLVYPKTNVLTTKVRVFLDFLIEKIGKAPAWMD